jgi:hypothetical protein
MKHTSYFDNFMKNVVNLSQFRLDVLEGRVESIYNALKADPVLGPRIIKKIPQGSWPQRTIISPQNGKAFDGDFMLQMKEEPEWESDLRQYGNAVYNVLHNHSDYKNMKHGRKCRCIYVQYANNAMHVDIVPYVIKSDGTQQIIDRDNNRWEPTNPSGFTSWMQEKDKTASGNLRKVIRLLKFLRDHKNSFTGTKSILITTLLGERVEEWRKVFTPGYYSDLPTALLHIVSDLDEWLQGQPYKPSIQDPSRSGATFDHRWSQETYGYFRDRIHVHAAEIKDAYNETDAETSVAKWQSLFGDKFQAPATSSSSGKYGAAGAIGTDSNDGTWSSSRSGRAG